jgi:hypothetical protein
MQLGSGLKYMREGDAALSVLNRLLSMCPGCAETPLALLSAAELHRAEDRLTQAVEFCARAVAETRPPRGLRRWHLLLALSRFHQLLHEQLTAKLAADPSLSKVDLQARTDAEDQRAMKEREARAKSAEAESTAAAKALHQAYRSFRSGRAEALEKEAEELQGTYNVLLKKRRQAGASMTKERLARLARQVTECRKRFYEVQVELRREGKKGDGKLVDRGLGRKKEPVSDATPLGDSGRSRGLWQRLKMGVGNAEAARQRMMEELDADGDGKVSKVEMVAYARKKSREAKAEAKRQKARARAKAKEAKAMAKAKAREAKAKAKEAKAQAKAKAKAAGGKALAKAKAAGTKAKDAALAAADMLYECENDCGFRGSYAACCAHESTCDGSPWEEESPECDRKPEQLFECEKDCGFRGTYDACCAHEEVCDGSPWPGKQAASPSQAPVEEDEVREDRKVEKNISVEVKEKIEGNDIRLGVGVKEAANDNGKENTLTFQANSVTQVRPSISGLSIKQLAVAAEGWQEEPSTWLECGMAFDAVDLTSFACDFFALAVALDAENFREWHRLAVCFHRTGRASMAMTALENALTLDPEDYDLRCLAAVWRGLPRPKLPPKSALSTEEVERLSVPEVRKELRARSLPFKGDTNALRLRLRRAVEQEDVVERRRFLAYNKKRRFQAERRNGAAASIQRIARGRRSRKALGVLRRQRRFERKRRGIVRLQAHFRGWEGRRSFSERKKVRQEELEAAVLAAAESRNHGALKALLDDAEVQFGLGIKLSKHVFVAARKMLLQLRSEVRDAGGDPDAVEAECLAAHRLAEKIAKQSTEEGGETTYEQTGAVNQGDEANTKLPTATAGAQERDYHGYREDSYAQEGGYEGISYVQEAGNEGGDYHRAAYKQSHYLEAHNHHQQGQSFDHGQYSDYALTSDNTWGRTAPVTSQTWDVGAQWQAQSGWGEAGASAHGNQWQATETVPLGQPHLQNPRYHPPHPSAQQNHQNAHLSAHEQYNYNMDTAHQEGYHNTNTLWDAEGQHFGATQVASHFSH